MAVRVMEASAVISAHDRTGNTFQRIAAKMKALESGAAALGRRSAMIDRATAATERGSTVIAGAASRLLAPAALGYAATRAFRRYAETEMAITRIGITADATDQEIKALHRSLRDLSANTGKPFDEVAEGLNQLVTGGLDLPQAMPAMPAIVRTAQAAGAEVRDIAQSSLALSQALGIAADRMQDAFDIMVEGGKAGKFELKDMARYFPSIAPAAAAVGMKGEEGLKRIVALLQVIRNGTGTVEEAASSVSNIFAKMESEETAKRFQKFGIDLRAEMKKGRKEGRDLLEVFTDLTSRALGGDLSKIPQLFSDMEFARGMRALLSYRDMLGEVLSRLEKAKGATGRDFDRVMTRSQISINRLSESWDRATESFGRLIDVIGGSKGLQTLAGLLENLAAAQEKSRENAPKSLDEFRQRYLDKQDSDRLAALDREITAAGDDLTGAEAIAKQRRERGQPPLLAGHTDARKRLERLRTERELLRLNMAARNLPWPETAPVIDPDLRQVPMPVPSPRRAASALATRQVPLPVPSPRRTTSFPAYGSIDDLVTVIRSEKSAPVEATLKGGADVNVKVTVEPSPDFFTRVRSIVSSVFGNIRINGGRSETGSTGSTGVTMPEAGSP
ncbi:MAG: phage tail tape measure protein [Pseudorhodoplanes sp.]|jgi:TP901 family phage tail tape measure protein|nr:phage tail tape measure protein [Pseudorhodoplanes sp.]